MNCPKCGEENRTKSKYCSKCGTALMGDKNIQPLLSGTILSERYKVSRLIKSGGMGAVYEVIDERFGDKCALKEMLPSYTSKSRDYLAKRFEEEAKLLRRLHHNSLPRVTDYFTHNGLY